MLENRHPALERHPQNNSIMPEIMLDWSSGCIWCPFPSLQTWIQNIIASFTNFELAAMMDRQLASLSSLTKWCNGAKRHYEVAIKPFNMLMHLKHLEAKISQYSYHTYVIIIIIIFIIILFMLKKKWRLCRHYARLSDYSIMPNIMPA